MPKATTWQVRQYMKLDKDEHGLTQLFSVRMDAAGALSFILSEFPKESFTVEENSSISTITIDWDKVPDHLRVPEIPKPHR